MEKRFPKIFDRFGLADETKERVATIAYPLLIVLAGIFVMSLFILFREAPPKTEVKKIATLVDTAVLKQQASRRLLEGYGTVQPRQYVELRPQVSGNIIAIHPHLQVGGRIAKGETLFQIDPTDYEYAVQMKEAARARAGSELQLEEGNQIVAKREWELLEKSLKKNDVSEDLALRKPHLQEKKAALLAAVSDLKRAQLDLSRTSVKAPFDLVILEESVDLGQYVSPQNQVVRFAATDEFQIEVRIPRANVSAIDFASNGEPETPVDVDVLQRVQDGATLHWKGKLIRLLSTVDDTGRMARLLIGVRDPLQASDGHAPLLIGSYVQVRIEGKHEAAVFSLPQKALREGQVIWKVGEDEKLDVIKVDVVFARDGQVYFRGDLEDGDRVVLTNLTQPLEGMLLEVSHEQAVMEQGAGHAER